jgi:uncharacterized protein
MFLSPMLSRPGVPHQLTNVNRGTVLATSVEAAFDSASRNRGLLGRDSLSDGTAIVIAPSNSVHMFFMRFPIDAIFVARDGRVVKTCANLRPWRIAVACRAFAVIEGPVGMIERTRTVRGDSLAFRPIGG